MLEPQLRQTPHPTRLLEVHEVAYQLKCSQETVRRLIRERKLAAIRLGTQWRVDPPDLQAFIDAQRVQIAAVERAIDQQLGTASRRAEALHAALPRQRPDGPTKVPA
jgi:excisionase family DNA binding protein